MRQTVGLRGRAGAVRTGRDRTGQRARAKPTDNQPTGRAASAAPANLPAFRFFFFKQNTAYEITYGDWSSDVCSSDLVVRHAALQRPSVFLVVGRVDGEILRTAI